MPPVLAFCVFTAFILWLVARDRKRRQRVTTTLWIPLVWILILGSRPVSTWFGFVVPDSSDGYVEGSPFDRFIFLSLIGAGLFVLLRRGINWKNVIANNRWLFIFFLYLGISTLWSDYTFVSFKRWIKDFGNVVMVLVILSEDDPKEAVKAVLARSSSVLIPLSVLFIKYYPELGRYYNRWTYEPSFAGVATDKNMLGAILFVCGLFLFWNLLELRKSKGRDRVEVFAQLVLMLMTLWLVSKAHSSTALVCTIVGACVLLGMTIPEMRARIKQLGVCGLAAVAVLLVMNSVLNLHEVIVTSMGRDMTLTGRTEIWGRLLEQKTNPLIGAGYYSFWLGHRVENTSEDYYYHLNEAHNGYLETYLNSGLVGLFLLIMVLISALRKTHLEIMARRRFDFGEFRLAFLVATGLYGITEAVFDRLNLVWFVFLLLLMKYPRLHKTEVTEIRKQHEPLMTRGNLRSTDSESVPLQTRVSYR